MSPLSEHPLTLTVNCFSSFQHPWWNLRFNYLMFFIASFQFMIPHKPDSIACLALYCWQIRNQWQCHRGAQCALCPDITDVAEMEQWLKTAGHLMFANKNNYLWSILVRGRMQVAQIFSLFPEPFLFHFYLSREEFFISDSFLMSQTCLTWLSHLFCDNTAAWSALKLEVKTAQKSQEKKRSLMRDMPVWKKKDSKAASVRVGLCRHKTFRYL